MGEDTTLLVFCYALFWVTLIALIYNSKNKQRTLILNVIIQAVYSVLFFGSMLLDPFGGGATIIFLRNINRRKGLCNGTRLIVGDLRNLFLLLFDSRKKIP